MIRSNFYHCSQLFKCLALAFVSVLMQVSGVNANECSGPKGSGSVTECNPSTDFSELKQKAEPASKYSFVGVENKGFFIKGSIPREKAIELAGKDLPFMPADSPERVRCALLAVDIDMNLLPLFFIKLKWNYPEAIWMLELREGSYLAIKAHTTSLMKYVLEYLDKYNTSYGLITLNKQNNNASVSIRAEGDLAFSATLSEAKQSDISLIEKLWTRDSHGKYYRIPWGTAKPEESYSMEAVLEDSLGSRVFGDVIWDTNAKFYLKRKHQCSAAIPGNPDELSLLSN